MKPSGKWKRSLAAGLLGAVLFASVASGAESRMQAQRVVSNRPATPDQPARVVEFKTERTDSWLCEYVSPFFCSVVPTVIAAPQPGPSTTRQRGRR